MAYGLEYKKFYILRSFGIGIRTQTCPKGAPNVDLARGFGEQGLTTPPLPNDRQAKKGPLMQFAMWSSLEA